MPKNDKDINARLDLAFEKLKAQYLGDDKPEDEEKQSYLAKLQDSISALKKNPHSLSPENKKELAMTASSMGRLDLLKLLEEYFSFNLTEMNSTGELLARALNKHNDSGNSRNDNTEVILYFGERNYSGFDVVFNESTLNDMRSERVSYSWGRLIDKYPKLFNYLFDYIHKKPNFDPKLNKELFYALLNRLIDPLTEETSDEGIEDGVVVKAQQFLGRYYSYYADEGYTLSTYELTSYFTDGKANFVFRLVGEVTPSRLKMLEFFLEKDNTLNLNLVAHDKIRGDITPIKYAIKRGNVPAIEFLMKRGVKLPKNALDILNEGSDIQVSDKTARLKATQDFISKHNTVATPSVRDVDVFEAKLNELNFRTLYEKRLNTMEEKLALDKLEMRRKKFVSEFKALQKNSVDSVEYKDLLTEPLRSELLYISREKAKYDRKYKTNKNAGIYYDVITKLLDNHYDGNTLNANDFARRFLINLADRLGGFIPTPAVVNGGVTVAAVAGAVQMGWYKYLYSSYKSLFMSFIALIPTFNTAASFWESYNLQVIKKQLAEFESNRDTFFLLSQDIAFNLAEYRKAQLNQLSKRCDLPSRWSLIDEKHNPTSLENNNLTFYLESWAKLNPKTTLLVILALNDALETLNFILDNKNEQANYEAILEKVKPNLIDLSKLDGLCNKSIFNYCFESIMNGIAYLGEPERFLYLLSAPVAIMLAGYAKNKMFPQPPAAVIAAAVVAAAMPQQANALSFSATTMPDFPPLIPATFPTTTLKKATVISHSSCMFGSVIGWTWKAASTVFLAGTGVVASGYQSVSSYFVFSPLIPHAPSLNNQSQQTTEQKPEPEKDETITSRATTSTFNQSLSANDYLGVIVPYAAHYVRKYSPITLPWNRVHNLTAVEKVKLEKMQFELEQMTKDFTAQKTGRAAQCPHFSEQFVFVEKILQATQQQITQMLTSKKVTGTLLSDVEKNTTKVKETIHKIAQENQTLRHMAIKEQRLQKRNARTGQQSATVTNYNAATGQLQQQVIRDATRSTAVVDLALSENRQSLQNANGHCATSSSSFWHMARTTQQSLPVMQAVDTPRLG